MSALNAEWAGAGRDRVWDPQRGPLRGRTIFLSASVPHPERDARFRAIPDAQREIESAVVALARAIFSSGGRLLFGGHPSITPLVAMVAGEFVPVGSADEREERGDIAPPVIVYQLDVYRPKMTEATKLMERLGLFRIEWCETLRHEADRKEWPANETRYPESLERMRRLMESPNRPHGPSLAMVCMGGMEGVLEEAVIYRELNGQVLPRRRIVTFAATGGAAGLLSSQTPVPTRDVQGEQPDRVPELVASLRGEVAPWEAMSQQGGVPTERRPAFVPYAALCAEFVDMLAQHLT